MISDELFLNELNSIELEQHLVWANQSLLKISEVFEAQYGEFKQKIMNEIRENFVNI